jgi:hypothetical protein
MKSARNHLQGHLRIWGYSFGGIVFAGTVLLMAINARAQNLFVGDEASNRIIQITPSGVRSTFATGMWQVYHMAFDNQGNLFAGLVGGVVKITPSGGQSYISYDGLYGLAFNGAGDLFGADYNSGNIYRYSSTGVRSTFVSGLAWPTGLAFDSAGNLFVGSDGDGRDGNIYKYSPAGVRSTFATGFSRPNGLAFNSAGDLFVADGGDGSIVKVTQSGVQSTFASGLSSLFGGPEGLAFNSAGDLFVAVRGTGNIYQYAPDGTRRTFASGLTLPTGLAFQPVPEPSTFGLLVVGVPALFVRCRQKRGPESGKS